MKPGSLVELVGSFHPETLAKMKALYGITDFPRKGEVYEVEIAEMRTFVDLDYKESAHLAIAIVEFPQFTAFNHLFRASLFRELQPPGEVSIKLVMASVDEHEFIKQFQD